MAKRRTSARPAKQKAGQANMVAAAVELAGGVPAVAKLCGVSRQTVYSWIREWRVERLTEAVKLSQASGIPVEKFVGETLGSKPSAERK
jgi:transposase-like protein